MSIGDPIREVEGTITLAGGQRLRFTVDGEGWTQWGGSREEMGESRDAVARIFEALREDRLILRPQESEGLEDPA